MKTRKRFYYLLGVVALILLSSHFFNGTMRAEAATGNLGFLKYDISRNNKDGDYVSITGYSGMDATVKIPETIEGYKVKYVSISDNKYIEKIILPKTVTTIYKLQCENLKEVNLESVKYISDFAFSGTSLKSVKLTSAVTIGMGAFKNCTSLTNVDFGNHTVEGIGPAAFSNTGITSLKLKVNKFTYYQHDWGGTSRTEGVFKGCINLKTVNLDVSDGVLTENLFLGCTSLSEVKLADTIEIIGTRVFYNCTSLKTIQLPKALRLIASDTSSGRYAFEECTSLEEITIPSGVEELNISTFDGCSSLKKINLTKGLLYINSSSYRDNNRKPITWTFNTIPNTVKSIWLNKYTVNDLLIPNSVSNFDQANKATFQYYSDSPLAEEFAKNPNATALEPIPSTEIIFSNKKNIVLTEGDKVKLSVSLLPANTTDAVVWESSDNNVAMVNGLGVVTAGTEGQVVIRATTTSGLKADITIKVVRAPRALDADETSITLGVGETFTRKGTVDKEAYDKKVLYTSSNPLIATVSSTGKVTAKKAGNTVITLTTVNGIQKSYNVTVKKAPSKITLVATNKTLKLGYVMYLDYKLPSNTYSNKITYSSSNSKIATVNKYGVVKANKTGTVKITVKTFNGKTSTVTIKVVK